MKLKALLDGGWLQVRAGSLPKGIFVLHALHILEREGRISKEALQHLWEGQFQLLQVEALKADDSQALIEAKPVQQVDFKSLLLLLGPDMAFTGQKAVLVQQIQALHGDLGEDREDREARKALEQTALSILEHPLKNFFHHSRAMKRLHPFFAIRAEGRAMDASECRELALTVCKSGLLPMMDAFCQRMQQGATRGDLLETLCLAAMARLMGAAPEARAHACWPLIYLASVAEDLGEWCPSTYVQAAALLNFLPDAGESLAEGWVQEALSGDRGPSRECQWIQALAEDTVEEIVEDMAEAPWLLENRTRLMALGAVLELKTHVREPIYRGLMETLAKTFSDVGKVRV